MIPEYAIGFVARVENAMAATLSPRKNSLSYSAEGKVCEAHADTAISDRSRNPIAYSGMMSTVRKGKYVTIDQVG